MAEVGTKLPFLCYEGPTWVFKTLRDINFLKNLDSSSNPVSLDHRCLRSLNNRHSALLKQNNIRWAQRALMLWLNKGDLNSKFFHNMGRVRSHRNKISEIKDTL